jgi:PPP family 3-phenylpropionic acid transporter
MPPREFIPWPEPQDDEEEAAAAAAAAGGAAAAAKAGAASASPDDAHFLAWHARDPHLLLHKALYFALCAALAAYVPYLVQWMTAAGLTSLQAGSVFALGQCAGVLLSPLLARLADASERHRRALLLAATAGQAAALLAMRGCTSYAAIAACFVATEACTVTIFPLLDASIQRLLCAVHGHSDGYGAVRAWGAAGWGLFGWAFGAVYDAVGSHDLIFPLFAVAQAPCLLLAVFLPLERRGATASSDALALRALARWDFAAVALVLCICSMLLTALDLYRFSYLETLGASNQLMGLSLAAASLSETPFFFFTGAILRALGVGRALVLVAVGYAARFVWYAFLRDPRLTVPAELLHGVTFALSWAAATQYVGQLLPPELASTAQGLLSALVWGVGGALGSLFGGGVVQAHGWQAMWLAGAGLAVAAAAVMAGALAACPVRGGAGGGAQK